MASEKQLIERIRRKLPSGHRDIPVGIGDDAAVLVSRKGVERVVTTDAFLEDVHFWRRVHPPRSVGYKALARAASDLAAMGARSGCFFLTLGLPSSCAEKWFDGFLAGLAAAARRFDLVLAGGDTTRYPKIAIALTLIGEIDTGRAILRSGARPGDLVCVSGRLGEAELGLHLLQRRLHRKIRWKRFTRKHFHPEPRLALGQWLAAHNMATAMIDTSDGLSIDLGHICQASHVGAQLWAVKIPSVRVPPPLERLGLNPMQMALDGGEDYELLFTVPKAKMARLPSVIAEVPVAVIGEITRGKGMSLLYPNGKTASLRPGGWDPFRSSRQPE